MWPSTRDDFRRRRPNGPPTGRRWNRLPEAGWGGVWSCGSVLGLDDDVDEGEGTFELGLSNASGAQRRKCAADVYPQHLCVHGQRRVLEPPRGRGRGGSAPPVTTRRSSYDVAVLGRWRNPNRTEGGSDRRLNRPPGQWRQGFCYTFSTHSLGAGVMTGRYSAPQPLAALGGVAGRCPAFVAAPKGAHVPRRNRAAACGRRGAKAPPRRGRGRQGAHPRRSLRCGAGNRAGRTTWVWACRERQAVA